MKCLDKKRIKMKGGESLACNERIMLSLVSTGVSGSRHFNEGGEWSEELQRGGWQCMNM